MVTINFCNKKGKWVAEVPVPVKLLHHHNRKWKSMGIRRV
jgi:hypothetical protein